MTPIEIISRNLARREDLEAEYKRLSSESIRINPLFILYPRTNLLCEITTDVVAEFLNEICT